MNWSNLQDRALQARTNLANRIREVADLHENPDLGRLLDELEANPVVEEIEQEPPASRSMHALTPPPPKELPTRFLEEPKLVSREVRALKHCLTPLPDKPNIIFWDPDDGLIRAEGMVHLSNRLQLRLSLNYPNDYPIRPPRAFFFGAGLTRLAGMLAPDGAVPVPNGINQNWKIKDGPHGGYIVAWALKWLEEVALLEFDAAAQCCRRRRLELDGVVRAEREHVGPPVDRPAATDPLGAARWRARDEEVHAEARDRRGADDPKEGLQESVLAPPRLSPSLLASWSLRPPSICCARAPRLGVTRP